MEPTLIVDSDTKLCRRIRVQLSQLDEQAICMHSGALALQYLKDHIPRLIILEVVLPDMNGIELLRHIRSDTRLAIVPVVLYSAIVTLPGFGPYAIEQGASEFWVKSDMLFSNLKQLVAPYLMRAILPSTKPQPPEGAFTKRDPNQKLN